MQQDLTLTIATEESIFDQTRSSKRLLAGYWRERNALIAAGLNQLASQLQDVAPRSFTQVKAKRAQSIEFGRYTIQLGFGLRADQYPTDPGQPDAEVESRRPGILLIEKNQVCAQVHRQSQSLRFTRAELLTQRQG